MENLVDIILEEYRQKGIPCGVTIKGTRKLFYFGRFFYKGILYTNEFRNYQSYEDAGLNLIDLIKEKIASK